jgi:hypothetical protein
MKRTRSGSWQSEAKLEGDWMRTVLLFYIFSFLDLLDV